MVKCEYCNLDISSRHGLKKHKSFSHDVCQKCNQKFSRRSELVFHMVIFHNKIKRSYQCQPCNKSFQTRKEFKKHEILETCHNRNGFAQRRTFILSAVIPKWLVNEPDPATMADTDSCPSSDED